MAMTKLELPVIPISTEDYWALVNDAEKQGTNLATLVGEFLRDRARDLTDWKITPIEVDVGKTNYTLSQGYGMALMLCRPQNDYSVELIGSIERTQYEWYVLNQRMVTLVEAARSSERIADRDTNNDISQCHVCGHIPHTYVAWGHPCPREGCRGTLFRPGTFPPDTNRPEED